MAEETPKRSSAGACGTGGGIYGLAFIGAAVYFLQQADTFWQGAVGLVKALLWPAFLIYQLFEMLGR